MSIPPKFKLKKFTFAQKVSFGFLPSSLPHAKATPPPPSAEALPLL